MESGIPEVHTTSPPLLPLLNGLEDKLFAEVGDAGFDSSDFELVQQLGSISMQQAFPEGRSKPNTAVIAYAARFHSRVPYSRPVVTFNKEYLPIARAVACNELLLLKHLLGIPEDKYAAASQPSSPKSPPVVPLLGYFFSAPTDDAALASTDDSIDSIWLVYKWEGLRPLSMLMQEGPPKAAYGLLKSREAAEEEAWAGRCATLKAMARGLLSAIDFCHSADVAHGSLSSGSVFLGPWEDLKAGPKGPARLDVKLDGFGFGKWYTFSQQGTAGALKGASFGPLSDDAALEAGKKADLQAAALLLAEAFVSGLAPGTPRVLLQPGTVPEAPAGSLDRSGLQRLLFDVFHEDIQQFREYCLQDPSRYERLVDFLDKDDMAGWQLLELMLQGVKSALELSQHRFLTVAEPTQRSGGLKLPWS